MADAIYQPQTQVKCLEGCGVILSNDNPVTAAGDAAAHASFNEHMVITDGPNGITVYNRGGRNEGSFTKEEWERRKPRVVKEMGLQRVGIDRNIRVELG